MINKNDIIVNFINNLPITRNQYPIFNFYPKFAVDSEKTIREKI